MKIAVLCCLLSAAAFAQTRDACSGLADLTIAGAKITAAHTVAAGEFTPPGPPPANAAELVPFKKLPAFCRIEAVSKPSSDSDIHIEVWIPASEWNGKLVGFGNGGFAGAIGYGGLASAVATGYAGASSDSGHSASAVDASWALGHPEKVIDFGYRAAHEMTRVGKAAAFSFSGKDPRRSYFLGCSDGGREALMEAQRFPDDYDGIVAIAPANNWTHLLTSAVWDAQTITRSSDSYIPSSKLPAIAAAANKACDAQDGVTDGVIDDPHSCRFDPAVLKCDAADSDSCLTDPQITTLRKLYEGAHDSQAKAIFPGFVPGGETGGGGWATWITGRAPGQALLFLFGNGFFGNMVYEKANWDYKSVSIDDALRAADTKLAGTLNSTNPDLSAFQKRGGKLLLFHGWSDAAISALTSVEYFNAVVGKMGQRNADSFLRFYLMPGVQHCAGGPGPSAYGQDPAREGDAGRSAFLSLVDWVERGTAPGPIVASKRAPGSTQPSMTRPLCPYPQHAKYKGSGDSNDAANFICAAK